MKVVCEGCDKHIDLETEESYTVINNMTGKKEILCVKCHAGITGTKRVNQLLREVEESQKNKKGKR